MSIEFFSNASHWIKIYGMAVDISRFLRISAEYPAHKIWDFLPVSSSKTSFFYARVILILFGAQMYVIDVLVQE